jgi:[acyl-carrier-protein] S-malonyltransferase
MINSVGILFAGQGAQFVGMGKDFAKEYKVSQDIFEQANEILGYNIANLCFEGPEKDLVKSQHCQPAIFAVSVACLKALQQKIMFTPKAVAGLSLGEWTALYFAGSISFKDTILALQKRGLFMQDACLQNAGAMLSVIGLSKEKVREIAEQSKTYIANYNSPTQTVLSGYIDQIDIAENIAKKAGAKRAVRLNVAGAYHSPLMEPAAQKLKDYLADVHFEIPDFPVMCNVTGAEYKKNTDEIKNNLIQQVVSSVRWVSCIHGFRQQGVSQYIECGPGKVLTGLLKRIDRQASCLPIQNCASLDKAVPILRA